MTPSTDRSFRADIAGLRAVAVMAVILFHFEVKPFQGGFVGVDVFFVISGYLMTGIIAGRVAKGTWRLRDFYWTRLLRIYPPMLALIFALLAAAYRFLDPDEYAMLAKHAVAAVASVSNLMDATETGYFAPTRESNWLLHLWSLAVEVQFYLFFPLLLVFLLKRGREVQTYAAIGALFFASLFASAAVTHYSASWAFFHLPTRLWEFLAGAIGFFVSKRRIAVPPWLLSLIGIALIAFAAIHFKPTTKFPSYRAVLPVLGAGLIVMTESRLFLLINPVSRFIGDISYSLYLWHWPVWVAARHYAVVHSPLNVTLLVTLSIMLGTASYYGIERPSNRLRHGTIPFPIRLAFPAASVVCVALSLWISAHYGLPDRAPALVRNVWARYTVDNATITRPEKEHCFQSPDHPFDKFPPECIGAAEPSSDRTVLVWGDSYADHLWFGLAKTAALANAPVLETTAASCPPLPDPPSYFNPACPALNKQIFQTITEKKLHTVVLFSRWQYYDQHDTDVVAGLRETIHILKSLGIADVLLVGPNPEWQPTLQQFAFQQAFLHGGVVPLRVKRPTPDLEADLDRRLAALADQTGIRYVSLFGLLCDGSGCLLHVAEGPRDELIEYDFGHLTIPAAEWVADHAFPVTGKEAAQ